MTNKTFVFRQWLTQLGFCLQIETPLSNTDKESARSPHLQGIRKFWTSDPSVCTQVPMGLIPSHLESGSSLSGLRQIRPLSLAEGDSVGSISSDRDAAEKTDK